MSEILIWAGGVYNILLIIFHLSFWRIFNWHEELENISFLNRATVPVLNISLTFIFFIFAYLSFAHTQELIYSELGRSLLVLMSLFWIARALQQIIFFKLKHWGSWAFAFYFTLGGVLYGLPIFMR